MTKHTLESARAYEKQEGEKIPRKARPAFHFTPYVGWMNDPNGFSCYGGMYHLFYQYNPYDVQWDCMHWGHAVSRDMLNWTYLPAAMAPDEEYDSFGCYSGSAAELPDGRQLLMYTGVRRENGRDTQVQCLAVGDGLDYTKYENNPVIGADMLPPGKSANDFRDPKIWREEDGSYRCVAATCDGKRKGALLLFKSADGFRWEFESTLIENDGRLGTMWECPDFFRLDGRDVLLVSPEEMLPEGYEYHNGHGTVCMIGHFDAKTKKFIPESNQAIDCGLDFYAPQTTVTPDGRRVMIGWLQNWDSCKVTPRGKQGWFGQMTLPRELHIENGRLYQMPVRELALYRSGKTEYKDVSFTGELKLDGIEGRRAELDITVRDADAGKPFRCFVLNFAQGGNCRTMLTYCPEENLLEIDRRFSGSRCDCVHVRSTLVNRKNGELRLKVILDSCSAEVFINDGEKAMTAEIMTDASAQGISFAADGQVIMDITKYSLFAEE